MEQNSSVDFDIIEIFGNKFGTTTVERYTGWREGIFGEMTHVQIKF